MWIEEEIERLKKQKEAGTMDEDDYASLCEYEGRLASINWERDYLNGEAHL